VRFTGLAGHPQCRIGVWAWHEVVLDNRVSVSVACPEPAMPPYRPDVEKQGICIKKPS
jgi:hypothetical protein